MKNNNADSCRDKITDMCLYELQQNVVRSNHIKPKIERRWYKNDEYFIRWGPDDLVANVLYCEIVICESTLKSRYYNHFWTNTFRKCESKVDDCCRGRPKAPFSGATTPRRWGRFDSFASIAPLYTWYVSYGAEC